MSLVINHNLMAMNAARNLGNSYNNLSTSVTRLFQACASIREYQAMASEISRIAMATDFNGVKLLDGSLSGIAVGGGPAIR